MVRPIRLEFEGALHQVTARGNRREDIYECDEDRSVFLSVLGDVCDRCNWVCHAFCLMSNQKSGDVAMQDLIPCFSAAFPQLFILQDSTDSAQRLSRYASQGV